MICFFRRIVLDKWSAEIHPNTIDHMPNLRNENNLTPNLTMCFPKTRGFKLAAINLTSLPKHIDQPRAYMTSEPIDILAINETRLGDTIHDNEMRIHGYVLERKN